MRAVRTAAIGLLLIAMASAASAQPYAYAVNKLYSNGTYTHYLTVVNLTTGERNLRLARQPRTTNQARAGGRPRHRQAWRLEGVRPGP